MFTTTPGRDSVASISATTSRTMKVAPVRFTSRTARQSSRGHLPDLAGRLVPPDEQAVADDARVVDERVQPAHRLARPGRRTRRCRPRGARRACACGTPDGSSASAASSTSPAATCAPASTRRRAKCAPIPRAAPVTIAFTSFSCMFPSSPRARRALEPVAHRGVKHLRRTASDDRPDVPSGHDQELLVGAAARVVERPRRGERADRVALGRHGQHGAADGREVDAASATPSGRRGRARSSGRGPRCTCRRRILEMGCCRPPTSRARRRRSRDPASWARSRNPTHLAIWAWAAGRRIRSASARATTLPASATARASNHSMVDHRPQQSAVREVERTGEVDEGRDALRLERREDAGERRAHAVPQQPHLRGARRALDEACRAREAGHDIVPLQVPVLVARRPPVQALHVEAHPRREPRRGWLPRAGRRRTTC